MQKIVSVSRVLKGSAFALCVALPILEAGYWITNGYPSLAPYFKPQILPVFGDWPVGWGDLTANQKFLGFLSNFFTLLFSMAALLYLAKVFDSLQKLKLFAKENALNVRKAGWALLWGQILHPLSTAALSLSLSCNNPVGHRNLSIAFGSHELAMLGLGLTLLLVSWLLEEAAQIHEEQCATV